jgi:signal transduction histidine kinase
LLKGLAVVSLREGKRLARIWLAGIVLLFALDTAMAQPRRVLLLHSFGPHFSPWNAISGRFREELIRQSPYAIQLYEASLQNERFGRPQDQGPFISYLHALFDREGLDLIVAMGAPAARFILQHRQLLFPPVPLLITGADERTFNDSDFTSNDTSVSTGWDQGLQIEHILQVLPDTANIALVIGDSPLEKFWVEEYRRSFKRFAPRVNFEWLNKLSLEGMVKRVSELPPHSAVLYGTVRVDAQGVPQEEDRVLSRLRESTNAPIFSYIGSNFGHGIVGGPMLSTQELAHRSTVAAIRILSGETAGNVKTPPLGLSEAIYDWRELQRWNISDANLPPGSTIYFRNPTAWEQYRFQIVAVLGAILAQSALISWLLVERRRRRTAEAATRQTMSDLQYVNRLAIAGELSASIAHEVNQPLMAIVSTASAGIRWLAATPSDPNRAERAFKKIIEAGHHASDVIVSVRAMFKRGTEEHRPVQINQLTRNALSLKRHEIEKHDVSLTLELNERLPVILGDRVQLLQVILNLITNAIEAMGTARTRTLRIKSELDKSADVLVSLEDSGIGIDQQTVDHIFDPLFSTKPQGLGIGLSICRSIIESHGGCLSVVSVVGHGSTFFIKLPKYKPSTSHAASHAWSQHQRDSQRGERIGPTAELGRSWARGSDRSDPYVS